VRDFLLASTSAPCSRTEAARKQISALVALRACRSRLWATGKRQRAEGKRATDDLPHDELTNAMYAALRRAFSRLPTTARSKVVLQVVTGGAKSQIEALSHRGRGDPGQRADSTVRGTPSLDARCKVQYAAVLHACSDKVSTSRPLTPFVGSGWFMSPGETGMALLGDGDVSRTKSPPARHKHHQQQN